MMNTSLIESLKTLSVAERIQLVEDLWDSIAGESQNFDLPKTQADELERRRDAIERNHVSLPSWTEVRSRILGAR